MTEAELPEPSPPLPSPPLPSPPLPQPPLPQPPLPQPRRRLSHVFLRPRRYFQTFTSPPGDGATILVFWLLGVIGVLDRFEMRDALGTAPNFSRIGWAALFGGSLVGGLVQGTVIYAVAGWWYGVRVRWCRPAFADGALARKVFGFSSLVIALPMVVVWAGCALVYESPRAYLDADGFLWLLVLLLPFWSIYASYRGVRTVFATDPARTALWFLALPAAFQGSCLAAIGAMAFMNAADAPAEAVAPSHVGSRTLSFDYPGEWTLAEHLEDHDLQRSVRVDAPVDASLRVQLYPTTRTSAEEVAATLEVLTESFDRVLDGRTPFKRWGAYRGNGVEVPIVDDGARYLMRIFVARVPPRMTLEVHELFLVAERAAAEPGFEMVRASLELTGKAPRSASHVDVAALVERLGSGEPTCRGEIEEELEELAAEGFSVGQGLLLLHAASRARAEDDGARAALLLEAAGALPDVAYVPRIVGDFALHGAEARGEALRILASIDERAGAAALVQLVDLHAGELPSLPLGTLDEEPRHADLLFPHLLRYAEDEGLSWGIHLLALRYLQQDALRPGVLGEHAASLVARYRAHAERLGGRSDAAAACEEEYRDARSFAGLLLDLLGWLDDPAAAEEVALAASAPDPRIAYFAVKAQLRRARTVEDRDLASIARSDELRNAIVDLLDERGELPRIPPELRDQAALARSEMAAWLAHPAELGCAPEALELVEVVAEGDVDYHVFRFRAAAGTTLAERGFMAGIAGGYARGSAPATAPSTGETFSRFEAWGEASAREHLVRIREGLPGYEGMPEPS